tara:strand:+ start:282 stop:467 length:186 start_codon:yes stop_codon:yes gene_type:complete
MNNKVEIEVVAQPEYSREEAIKRIESRFDEDARLHNERVKESIMESLSRSARQCLSHNRTL